jgi:hypothetical protein
MASRKPGETFASFHHLGVNAHESILYQPHDHFLHRCFFASLENAFLVSLPRVVRGSIGLP